MIETKIICDSIADSAPRLTTMFWRYPKFVHQESLRHRLIYFEDGLRGDFDFSFSVSSIRAIPFANLLEEVQIDEFRAEPVLWGTEKKGMSPDDELPDDDDPDKVGISSKQLAKNIWRNSAMFAAHFAESMHKLKIHKSIVNRIIEPFIHVNVLATATEPGWMNFFGLRLDRAADPTLRALAESAWKSYNENEPRKLTPGEWHLPFVDDKETTSIDSIKISVARCARVSYLSFETNKRSTIEEDLKLYDRLVGSSPIHASPAEHQATPDSRTNTTEHQYIHPEQSGNLGPGWRQYRKMLSGESLAPLPEGYIR